MLFKKNQNERNKRMKQKKADNKLTFHRYFLIKCKMEKKELRETSQVSAAVILN